MTTETRLYIPVNTQDATKVAGQTETEPRTAIKIVPRSLSERWNPLRILRYWKLGLALLLVVGIVILSITGVLLKRRNNRDEPSSVNYESSRNNPGSKILSSLPAKRNLDGFRKAFKFCDDGYCSNAANEILSSLNTSVDPCDNFYNFACQGWKAKNPRPDYVEEWSVFSKAQMQSINFVIDLLNEPQQQNELPALSSAKRYFRTCANTLNTKDKAEEQREMQFIWNRLESYGGWPILYKNGTWNKRNFDWMESVVGLKKEFGDTELIDISSFQHPLGLVNKNSIIIRPPSVASSSADSTGNELKVALALGVILTYKDFIVNVTRDLLLFNGKRFINETYLNIKAFEIIFVQREFAKLEEASMGIGPLSGRSEYTVQSLNRLLNIFNFHDDGIDIEKLLSKFYAGTDITIRPSQAVDVFNFGYLLRLSDSVSRMREDAIANYLHFKMVFQMVTLSNVRKFHGYLNTLRMWMDGTKKISPREHVCAAQVQKMFPFVLGYEYVAQRGLALNNPGVENLTAIDDMYSNIQSEYLQLALISRIPYLNRTLVTARTMLSDFCVGYPSWIYDKSKIQSEYSEISLSESYQQTASYLKQSIHINKWAANKRLAALIESQPLGECNGKWIHFPGTVGAFSRLLTVYIPVGMLQLPFYDSDLPGFLKYSKLGVIIGHELAHSLVGTGWSRYANGTNTPLANCFVEHYNNFKVDMVDGDNDNVTVNGNLTLGENLADNAGLLAAYNAYTSSLIEEPHRLKGLEEYTNQQLFYIGFAQNWCETQTEQGLENSLEEDVHSPGEFRVLGTLQNSYEFADAFKCPVGSNMNPRRGGGSGKCEVF